VIDPQYILSLFKCGGYEPQVKFGRLLVNGLRGANSETGHNGRFLFFDLSNFLSDIDLEKCSSKGTIQERRLPINLIEMSCVYKERNHNRKFF
jgi:hypothetical protein